jgi:hypothetical protein
MDTSSCWSSSGSVSTDSSTSPNLFTASRIHPFADANKPRDSNILIDFAAEEDYAHTFREEFQQRGYSLWLPPTVAHELLYASDTKSDPHAALARPALAQLLTRTLRPHKPGRVAFETSTAPHPPLAELASNHALPGKL